MASQCPADRLLPATSLRPPPDLSHRQSLHATSRPPRPSKLPQEALRLLQCTLGTTAPSPPTANDPTVKPVAPAVRGSRWPPYLPQGAQRLLACVLGATVPPPTTAIDCTGPPGINALGALVPSNPTVPDVTVPFVPRQMAPQAPPVSIGSGLAAALSSLNSEDGNLLMKSLHAAQQPARRRRRRRTCGPRRAAPSRCHRSCSTRTSCRHWSGTGRASLCRRGRTESCRHPDTT